VRYSTAKDSATRVARKSAAATLRSTRLGRPRRRAGEGAVIRALCVGLAMPAPREKQRRTGAGGCWPCGRTGPEKRWRTGNFLGNISNVNRSTSVYLLNKPSYIYHVFRTNLPPLPRIFSKRLSHIIKCVCFAQFTQRVDLYIIYSHFLNLQCGCDSCRKLSSSSAS
jgi:hypothetical protein